jgi:hypothetical protein
MRLVNFAEIKLRTKTVPYAAPIYDLGCLTSRYHTWYPPAKGRYHRSITGAGYSPREGLTRLT